MEQSGRRERKKAETRQRILECASELFSEKGYVETSLLDITEAADVAPRTFYQHFSSKADVALAQVLDWVEDIVGLLETRPPGEAPLEMLTRTLEDLKSKGYLTGQVRYSQDGSPLPPIGTALWWADASVEVAGRLFQVMVDVQTRLTEVFRDRTGADSTALEPRFLAGALVTSWLVAAHSIPELLEKSADPPSMDEVAVRTFLAYWSGLESCFPSPEPAEVLPASQNGA